MDLQVVEIDEAINAGNDLLTVIEKIEKNLRSAKTWGFIDMFSDAGLVTSILKHSKLHDAEAGLKELKYCLDNFNKELKDVRVNCDIERIQMDRGIEICDWLIDGFIFDSYTIAKILKSSKQISELKINVLNVLDNLRKIKGEI